MSLAMCSTCRIGPIQGATVLFYGVERKTCDDGCFRFGALLAVRAFQVEVSKPGYKPYKGAKRAASYDLSVHLAGDNAPDVSGRKGAALSRSIPCVAPLEEYPQLGAAQKCHATSVPSTTQCQENSTSGAISPWALKLQTVMFAPAVRATRMYGRGTSVVIPSVVGVATIDGR